MYPKQTRYNFFKFLVCKVYGKRQDVTKCYNIILMSSNITIPKICVFCNKGFIAKTTVTKFCSHACASRSYKQVKKEEKVKITQINEYQKSVGIDMSSINSKEFLSIKETCLLLGISRMSLHRYVKMKIIKPTKLVGRIIIKRQSLNNLIK